MELNLKGKKAIVAASSKGLGFATAEGLAREGVDVAINGRHPESLDKIARDLSQKYSIECLSLPGDIGDPAVPAHLVEKAVAAWGRLDLLVTNSGGPPSGKFDTFNDNDWQKAIDTLFLSHVRMIRAALPYLRLSSAASVLTITSYSVKQPIQNLVLSNSIRSATVGLTKTLALELGSQGIRMNSILPAWIATERTMELDQNRAQNESLSLEQVRSLKAKDTALGRIGTPVEFANAAVFLLSPAAAYITGVMFTVDGGMYKGVF